MTTALRGIGGRGRPSPSGEQATASAMRSAGAERMKNRIGNRCVPANDDVIAEAPVRVRKGGLRW